MSFPSDSPPWGGSPPQNVPPAAQWGGSAWGAPAYWPAAARPARSHSSDRVHVLPTIVLAAIIATVVLGGIALNGAMAAPSAGTVVIGGYVKITAAPGWVLSADSAGTTDVVELRTADAILVAQVVQRGFDGDPASLLDAMKTQLQQDADQVSFGDSHSASISGNQAAYVTFQATVSSSDGSGVLDGEIVCVVVGGAAVVVEVATPQGRFDYVAGDVTAMLESLRPA